ncbi:MAG TPA: cyclic nucleotide-binding domain-containing protein [Mycobacteriales bacterium]|nr:cyclic nucleotide-binding domain-containing protein [Mycobacteriales bacterium]
MTAPDPARLASVELFQDLSDEDREHLAAWMEVEEIPAGHVMLREHTSGYAFFILDEGRAHAEADGKVLEVLEPGAVFGEMAFFAPDGERTATIVPETPLRVYTMFGTRFRQMQQELPEVASRLRQIVETRADRLRAADQA